MIPEFVGRLPIAGARALRAVCEEIMLDLMYKLPDVQQGGKYIIDEHIVEGRRESV